MIRSSSCIFGRVIVSVSQVLCTSVGGVALPPISEKVNNHTQFKCSAEATLGPFANGILWRRFWSYGYSTVINFLFVNFYINHFCFIHYLISNFFHYFSGQIAPALLSDGATMFLGDGLMSSKQSLEFWPSQFSLTYLLFLSSVAGVWFLNKFFWWIWLFF